MIVSRFIRRRDRLAGQRGAALLPVILLLGLLSMLVTAFSVYVTNSATAIAIARDRIMQNTLVDSALAFGMGRIFSTPAGLALQGEDQIRLASGRAKLKWTAESARLNINYAPEELLVSLLKSLDLEDGKAVDLARLIVARRSLNPTQPIPKLFQTLAGKKLGLFEHPRELLDMPGLSSGLFNALEPLITVYGATPAIDPRLADDALLKALPNVSGPILAELSSMRELNDEDAKRRIQSLGELARYFDVTRKTLIRFHIDLETVTGQQYRFEIVTTHFADDAEPYRVLMWREITKTK